MVHGSPIPADRNGRFEICHGKVNPSGLVFWFGGLVATTATANGKFWPSGCREYWLPEPEKTTSLAEILGAAGYVLGGNPGARLHQCRWLALAGSRAPGAEQSSHESSNTMGGENSPSGFHWRRSAMCIPLDVDPIVHGLTHCLQPR
jgi:hypothetical protein